MLSTGANKRLVITFSSLPIFGGQELVLCSAPRSAAVGRRTLRHSAEVTTDAARSVAGALAALDSCPQFPGREMSGTVTTWVGASSRNDTYEARNFSITFAAVRSQSSSKTQPALQRGGSRPPSKTRHDTSVVYTKKYQFTSSFTQTVMMIMII